MSRPARTVRQRRLVQEIRRLREEAALRQEDVAEQLDWSLSKQEKIERGAIGLRVADVRAMLDLFGLTAPEHAAQREALFQLAREARQKGWWHAYGDAIPPWFEAYVGLETDASALHSYQIQLVPGVLQTEDYARAVSKAVRPKLTDGDVEGAVAARMKRQARLTAEDPLSLWVVLDEAVLHREVGGSDVRHAQLEHLIEIGRLPNVTLQVLPFSAGAHASMGTSFNVIQFLGQGDPDVVYLEDLTSSAYLEEQQDIERYTLVFDHLRSAALTDHESTELIGKLVQRLS